MFFLLISTIRSATYNQIWKAPGSYSFTRCPSNLFGFTKAVNLVAKVNDYSGGKRHNLDSLESVIHSLRAGDTSYESEPDETIIENTTPETDPIHFNDNKDEDIGDDEDSPEIDEEGNDGGDKGEKADISAKFNEDDITVNDVPTSNNSDTNNTLFPYHYYTTIFSKDNDIFGKGRYHTVKERIENLLSKWENDDITTQLEDNSISADLEELKSLQSLMYERAREYIEDVHEGAKKALDKGKVGTIPHPKKVLHYIAPKVPAIKHTEILLRITSARIRVDVSAAACALSVMGAITEYYACILDEVESALGQKDRKTIQSEISSVFENIVADRRFEQLVECVQCGVEVEDMIQRTSHLTTETLLPNEEHESSNKNRLDTEVESPSLQDQIGEIDASKSIWALSVFLFHHHVDTLGEMRFSQLIHALKIHLYEQLINQYRRFQNGSNTHTSRITTEAFIHEIKFMLRNTVYVLWASSCAYETFTDDNSFIVQSCTHILNSNVEEIWDSWQKWKNEKAREEDIVDRLAEAEINENCHASDKEDELSCDDSHTTKIENTETCSKTVNEVADFLPGARLADFLSCSDLAVMLNSIYKMRNSCEKVIFSNLTSKLLDNINTWIEHDIKRLCDGQNFFSDQVQLIDAATILTANEKQLGGQTDDLNPSGSKVYELIDRGGWAMSTNDLGIAISILSTMRYDSVSLTVQSCFELLLSICMSNEKARFENTFVIQLLRDSSIHADHLMRSASSPTLVIDFYSKITRLVFDRFFEEAETLKSLSSHELNSLVSSLYSIYSSTEYIKHQYDNGGKMILEILKRSLDHVVDRIEDFSTSQLCQLASIFAASHRYGQDIQAETCTVLGGIVATITKDYNDWLNILSQDTTNHVPVAFNKICKLFCRLVRLNFHPYELCVVLSKAVQQQHLDVRIKNDELIQCLYSSARMRISNPFLRDTSACQLNSLVHSILSVHKEELVDSTFSLSPSLFSKLSWALAIHGREYSNVAIPNFSLYELKSMSHSCSIEMVSKYNGFNGSNYVIS